MVVGNSFQMTAAAIVIIDLGVYFLLLFLLFSICLQNLFIINFYFTLFGFSLLFICIFRSILV